MMIFISLRITIPILFTLSRIIRVPFYVHLDATDFVAYSYPDSV